jgi:Flp pilus assembly protein TadD
MSADQQVVEARSDKSSSELKKALIVAVLFLLPIIYLLARDGCAGQKPQDSAQLTGKALVEASEKSVALMPTANNYVYLSYAYIQNNQPALAIEPIMKALDLDPANLNAYNNLGVAYIYLKNYDKAESALKKAIELNPDFTLAKNNLKWAEQERRKNRK